MKKISIAVSAALLIGSFGITAYAQEDEIMQKLVENSTRESIFQTADRVETSCIFYYGDGTTETCCSYADKNKSVFESDSLIYVSCEDGYFGYNKEEKFPYGMITLDDSAEYLEQTYFEPLFFTDSGEIFSDISETEDTISITAYLPQDSEEYAFVYDTYVSFGYDVPEGAKLLEYITLDKDYRLISNVCAFQGDESEEPTIVSEEVRVPDPEEYQIPTEVQDVIQGRNVRNVTVIADPGTDEETVYQVNTLSGRTAAVWLSDQHPALYTDEACTVSFDPDVADKEDDLVLYTVKAE